VRRPDQISRTREHTSVGEQLLVTPRSSRGGSENVLAQQFRNQFVPAHTDEPVDGIHGNPLTGAAERPEPGESVEVVRAYQRPVDIKQHSGP
jgi:hypothetical protein